MSYTDKLFTRGQSRPLKYNQEAVEKERAAKALATAYNRIKDGEHIKALCELYFQGFEDARIPHAEEPGGMEW